MGQALALSLSASLAYTHTHIHLHTYKHIHIHSHTHSPLLQMGQADLYKLQCCSVAVQQCFAVRCSWEFLRAHALQMGQACVCVCACVSVCVYKRVCLTCAPDGSGRSRQNTPCVKAMSTGKKFAKVSSLVLVIQYTEWQVVFWEIFWTKNTMRHGKIHWPKFSKVSSLVIVCGKFSGKLTFENFLNQRLHASRRWDLRGTNSQTSAL